MSMKRGIGDNSAKAPLVTTEELRIDWEGNALEELEVKARKCPKEIRDDKTYGIWQDLIADCNSETKRVEACRVEVKEPYLKACGTVDGFFNGLKIRVGKAAEPVARVCGAYLERKRDLERREREAEAERLRKEAEAKEAEAEKQRKLAEKLDSDKRRDKADELAIEAMGRAALADAAEKAAGASSAELSRTRSDSGTLGTLKEPWDYEVTGDMEGDGGKLWPYVAAGAREAAVRAFMKAQAPQDGRKWSPLAGVRFFRTNKLQVRR
jgi:hypothetical protein